MRAFFMAAAALLALPVLSATSAQAAGWYVVDLGTMSSRESCAGRAQGALDDFLYIYNVPGRSSTSRTGSLTMAYGVHGRGMDVLITCHVEGGRAAPQLIIHDSGSNPDARKLVADRIRSAWNNR